MKIVVTGDHLGTIGWPLTFALLRAGHEGYRHRPAAPPGWRARRRRGLRAQLERALPGDAELVYHLAAEFGRINGEEYTEQVWRTNCVGTKNVLKLQLLRGFRLVFASSSEVYGEHPNPVLHEGLALSPFLLVERLRGVEARQRGADPERAEAVGLAGHDAALLQRLRPRRVLQPLSERCLPLRLPRAAWSTVPSLRGLPPRLSVHRRSGRDARALRASAFTPGLVANVAGREYLSVRELHEKLCTLVDVDLSRR